MLLLEQHECLVIMHWLVTVGDDVVMVEEDSSLHLVPYASVYLDHPVSMNPLVDVAGGVAWNDLDKYHSVAGRAQEDVDPVQMVMKYVETLEQRVDDFLFNNRILNNGCHGKVLYLPIRGPVDGGRLLTGTGL